MMEFIRSLIFIKTYILTKKIKKSSLKRKRDSYKRRNSRGQKRFKKSSYEKEEILTDKKNFHDKNRFSQMNTNKNKCVQINSE